MPSIFCIWRITPRLYRISNTAVSRFDYQKRKCIAESDNITLNVTDFSITEYTYTNCFVAAAVEEMNSKCLKKNDSVKAGTVDKDLACKYKYLSQVGRWNLDKKSNKYCFPSCLRSSIHIFTIIRTQACFSDTKTTSIPLNIERSWVQLAAIKLKLPVSLLLWLSIQSFKSLYL